MFQFEFQQLKPGTFENLRIVLDLMATARKRSGESVTVCLSVLLLSLMVIRSSASVVIIGKNVSLSFDDIESNFSPSIRNSGISGILYLAEPLDACSPLTNKVEGSNSFALIIRGECPFDDKVMAAQKAGFKVAIVYDNINGAPLVAMAGNPIGIKINAVFVSKASGETLKEFAGREDVDFWVLPTYESSAWSIMAISFISLLAMSAVLATCFFVRRHRIRRERPRGASSSEFHGMNEELVKVMPSLIFTTALEDNCTSWTCAICLEDYSVGELIRILPCRHKFHAQCVDSWLTTWRTFCPVCKRDAQTTPIDPLPSESTPLLSIPSSSSSFRRPFPSPSPSRAIQITPSPSPSSIPRHPSSSHRHRHLCSSPASMSRSSFSHRSLVSLSPFHHSASVNSFSLHGSSIGSPSYLAGSTSRRRQSFLLLDSPSAATLSASSLPEC